MASIDLNHPQGKTNLREMSESKFFFFFERFKKMPLSVKKPNSSNKELREEGILAKHQGDSNNGGSDV